MNGDYQEQLEEIKLARWGLKKTLELVAVGKNTFVADGVDLKHVTVIGIEPGEGKDALLPSHWKVLVVGDGEKEYKHLTLYDVLNPGKVDKEFVKTFPFDVMGFLEEVSCREPSNRFDPLLSWWKCYSY